MHGFFCVGSPVGLFQMLRGRNIAARSVMERKCAVNTPLGEEFRELVESGEVPVSCPKVSRCVSGMGADVCFSVMICIICGCCLFVG